MRPEDGNFDLQSFGGSSEVLCTNVIPYNKYINQVKTDEVEGFSYTCVLPKFKYERIVVKVPNHQPVITNEQLTEQTSITFEGFVARFWKDRSGNYQLSCKAEKAIIVSRGAAKS